MPTEIDPKHVLVIGAGPGLGSALARRFAREGFTVTLVGRRPEALDDLAAQLRQAGGTADTFLADASDALAFKASMQQLAERIAPGVVIYGPPTPRCSCSSTSTGLASCSRSGSASPATRWPCCGSRPGAVPTIRR